MGFDDRLWTYLVEEHDAHQAVGPAPARHRRASTRRGVAAGAVVLAAAAVGVVVLVAPSFSGQSAWAKQTLQRAAAVVIPPGSSNTILHIAATETRPLQQRRLFDPSVSTLSGEAWIQQGKPGAQRTIMQIPGGPVLEVNSAGLIYDQTSNTVYPAPQFPSGKPRYTLTRTANGTYRLRTLPPHGYASTPETITARTARALRNGTDRVSWSFLFWDARTKTLDLGQAVGPSSPHPQPQQLQDQQPNPAATSFAAQLHGLLNSGHARVVKTTTSDGQPAIKISTVDPQSGPRQTSYYVNPQTYAPIELDSLASNPSNDTRVHITAYQTLPLASNQRLLHVSIPPTARVDHDPGHYYRFAGLLPGLF